MVRVDMAGHRLDGSCRYPMRPMRTLIKPVVLTRRLSFSMPSVRAAVAWWPASAIAKVGSENCRDAQIYLALRPGSSTGMCGEVLTTRVLPSRWVWPWALIRDSTIKRNFSASMAAVLFFGSPITQRDAAYVSGRLRATAKMASSTGSNVSPQARHETRCCRSTASARQLCVGSRSMPATSARRKAHGARTIWESGPRDWVPHPTISRDRGDRL